MFFFRTLISFVVFSGGFIIWSLGRTLSCWPNKIPLSPNHGECWTKLWLHVVPDSDWFKVCHQTGGAGDCRIARPRDNFCWTGRSQFLFFFTIKPNVGFVEFIRFYEYIRLHFSFFDEGTITRRVPTASFFTIPQKIKKKYFFKFRFLR